MNNPNSSRSGNLVRSAAFGVAVVLGPVAAAGCSFSSPAESTSSVAPTPAPGPGAFSTETHGDVYEGSVVEIVAQPITPGPVGEAKNAALLAAWEVGDVVVDEETPGTVRLARETIDALGFPNVVRFGNRYVDARLASTTEYAGQGYITFSSEPTYLDRSRTAASEHEAAVAQIQDPEIRAAASTALDYEQAGAAVAAIDKHSPEAPQAELLLGFVADSEIKRLAEAAIAGDQAAADQLAEAHSQQQTHIDMVGVAARETLNSGSAFNATQINDSLERYAQGRAEYSVDATWLKDVGWDIKASIWNGLYDEQAAEAVAIARARAQNVPDEAVSELTLRAVDANIADWLSHENLPYDTTEHAAYLQKRDEVLALIQDPAIRQAITTELQYLRAGAAIEAARSSTGTDASEAATLLGAVRDADIKAAAQTAIGGDAAADVRFEDDAASATDAREALTLDANLALYYGSNDHAGNINTDFTLYNDAVLKDGR
jgi:hypothetical protein